MASMMTGISTGVASSLAVHGRHRGYAFYASQKAVHHLFCSFDPLLSRHGPLLGDRCLNGSSVDAVLFSGTKFGKAYAPSTAIAEDCNTAGVLEDVMSADEGVRLDKAMASVASVASAARVTEKQARKKAERYTYLLGAVLSSIGITSMAATAVGSRFFWQLDSSGVPVTEMLCTLALFIGSVVGMEFWARWAHRALWHGSLWSMHESHHKPRDGPFELNDIFVVVNVVPAVSLVSYGFSHPGLLPGLCFGAGLGITLYGMTYMIIHDGLVHRRLPVGPLGNVPFLRRVAAAHQIHHSGKLDGVPYGLFLGPEEVEKVGGAEELQKEIKRRIIGASI